MASPFITDPAEILARRQGTILRTHAHRWETLLDTLDRLGLDTAPLKAAKGNIEALDAMLLATRRELHARRRAELAANCSIPTQSALNVAIDQLGAFWATLEAEEG